MRDKLFLLSVVCVTVTVLRITTVASAIQPNKDCGVPQDKIIQNPADGVCSSIDIRSYVSNFRKLENCTVIEGYLHISLIDRMEGQSDYDQYTFPKLVEITDHLMLYRVHGLTTLRHIFPNLTVIRGRVLFYNYALVAYEVQDLEEIGLVNLRTIMSGGVRLTKNKKLCFIQTIDWQRIAIGVDSSAHHFMDNKPVNQCPNYCPKRCPATTDGNQLVHRCWNSEQCQKNLNCHCTDTPNQPCMENGTCCHRYCEGGCTGPGVKDCLVCKGVIYENKCQPRCPPSTYMFVKRRCLTDKECLDLRNKTEEQGGGQAKLLRGEKGEPSQCVFQCPNLYKISEEGDNKDLECVQCEGFCPKVCNSSKVNSIQDAQQLKHCSKITGPLVIQIMGGSNVAQEMENNLGEIREVTGYINIRRSYALMTLYFFRKLEIIGGEPLAHQQHSLMVMDNSNLQELFPEEQMKKMKIKKGKVAFHSNRKLCKYKIDEFVNYLNLSKDQIPTDQDISQSTNGDLTPCTKHHLNISVTSIYHNTIVLEWESEKGDSREISYVINYKEIGENEGNINIFQGRDACSDDVWMTREQEPKGDPVQVGVIGQLKAYTTYAVYVQAFSLFAATHSSMTDVISFTTSPFYPTEPAELTVTANVDRELLVRWKPPRFPNGKVTHYKIKYQKQALNVKSFDKANYCLLPILYARQTKVDLPGIKPLDPKNVTANCCACPKSKEELEDEKRKKEMEIYFEDHLHRIVYCKRYNKLPFKFQGMDHSVDDVIGYSSVEDVIKNLRYDSQDGNLTAGADTKNGHKIYDLHQNVPETAEVLHNTTMEEEVHEVLVYDSLEAVLPNLDHFQEYSIEVQACHDTNPEEPVKDKLCSQRAITLGRTKEDWTKDSINVSTIEVDVMTNKSGEVLIKWQAPPKPNGLVLKYNLWYKKANQDNAIAQSVCINRQDFKKNSGYRFTRLEPGNWSFRINPVTLAGNDSFTQPRFFVIPPPPSDESNSRVVIPITIICVLVTVFIVLLCVWAYASRRFNNDDMTVISRNMNYMPSDQMYLPDGWEVDRDKIKLIKELGQGSFGMVYEGIAVGLDESEPTKEQPVAVKTVNDRASFNDKCEFLKEATTMKAFDCYHVVKLLGVVSNGQPALVIMELMALGDLKHYLREHRPDEERPDVKPPSLQEILQMAGEMADGMAYLADKKFVHRDLAARNCMVNEARTLKIGDFGMTRDVYETDYYRKGGKGLLPVRWMAPESLKDGVFTTMSDVWSYGIVMWEMVTLATQPYQGLSNEEVVRYISDGSTMDMPDRCPKEMAYLMQRCWERKPKHRPTFKEIIEYLLPHLNANFKKVSYFFNEGGGPGDGGGPTCAGDESDEANSINSLSCEGASAPHLSSGTMPGELPHSMELHSSPLYRELSGGKGRFCDGDEANIQDNIYFRGSGVLDMGDSIVDMPMEEGGYDSNCDAGEDWSGPFFSMNYPAGQSSPSLLSHRADDPSTGDSGLIEMQPLIRKEMSGGLRQSELRTEALARPPSQSPPRQLHHPAYMSASQIDPSSISANRSGSFPASTGLPDDVMANAAVQDPYVSSGSQPGPSAAGDSSGSPNNVAFLPPPPPPSSSSSSSLNGPRALRLPRLNQPPGGGFRRTLNSGDKDKSSRQDRYSSRHGASSLISGGAGPFISGEQGRSNSRLDWSSNQPGGSSSVPGNRTLVTVEDGEDSSSPSAIDGSGEGSKDSSKSSGSHSLRNGLTNGYIPIPTASQSSAPC